jgi:hypothetical protein
MPVHSDRANSAITLAKNGRSHFSSGTLDGGTIGVAAFDITRTASDVLSILALRAISKNSC